MFISKAKKIPDDSDSHSVMWLCHTSLPPHGVACQAPLSMGFSRQEYWSELPFPSSGDLPNPGIKPGFPTLLADSSPANPTSRFPTLFFLPLQFSLRFQWLKEKYKIPFITHIPFPFLWRTETVTLLHLLKLLI